MNRPEFETQEEWRNGIQDRPWWREVDWPLVALTAIIGAALVCAFAGCL